MDICNHDVHIEHKYRVRSHISENMCEYSKLMSGFNIELNQCANGKFRGELTVFENNDLQMIFDKSNVPLQKKGESQYDIVISLPLNSHLSFNGFYCLGNHIDHLGVLIAAGTSLPELIVPKSAEIMTIGLNYFLIEKNIENSDFFHNITSSIFPLSHSHMFAEIEQCIELRKYESSAINHANISDAVMDFLSQKFDQSQDYHVSPHIRKQIVDQAREMILADSTYIPSISEVCQELGVCRRKLQYCFQDVLGVNPNTYIKMIRLNQVYRCLSLGAVSVQDAAYQWGFWHLSHFCTDYKKLFGELPSMTLSRFK